MLLLPFALAADPLPPCYGGAPVTVGTGTVTSFACGNTTLTRVEDTRGAAEVRAELRAHNESSQPGVPQREESWTLGGKKETVDIADRTVGGRTAPQYAWVHPHENTGSTTLLCRPPTGGVDRCQAFFAAVADGSVTLP